MFEFIIINGDEEFLKERAAASAAKGSLVDHIFTYNSKNIDKYIEEVSTPVLFDQRRAYIINNCSDVPDVLPGPKDVLILVSGKKKLVDDRAKIQTFPKLKTYDNNNEVIKWIIKEGYDFNIDLTRIAPALFINNGKSLRKLYSEIRKLAALKPKGGSITPSDAKSIICFSAELTPKEIVDSVCEGHTLKALAYYDKLQQYADETGWIIAYMQQLLITQTKMEILRQRRMKSKDIANLIGIHPFVFQRTQEPRIGLWEISSLKSGLDTLCILDLDHKRGKSSAKFGLESEIIRLSEESKNVKRN